VIGHFVDTREEAMLKGQVVNYEYTSLTANVTLKDEEGKEWRVGGLGSYFEDIEGEKFILLE
ncbi:transcriptional regulator, partial [Archaeoglobales archaeon ex4484_92]